MIFPDFEETGVVYHVVNINDLQRTLENGICYDDKYTYQIKYNRFHHFIDQHKLENIPDWVIRSKAIFASINYPESHKFHSHAAVVAVRINPERCWVANENCANQIYEPYILQNVEGFHRCIHYLQSEGKLLLKKYWETSLSFTDNIEYRMDKKEGYDAEVLIQHSIMPEDIEVKYIISDHRMMKVEAWKERFCI